MKVFYMKIICARKRTPVRQFNPYLQVKWLNIAQFDLQTIADGRVPNGTDRRTLSVASGISQVGRRDMRTRLKDHGPYCHDLGPILPSTAFPWSVKGYIVYGNLRYL